MIGYREQGIKCNDRGNRIKVNISKHMKMLDELTGSNIKGRGDEVLVCIKYEVQCSSKVCFDERENIGFVENI